MTTIYQAFIKRLQEKVATLKWIDADSGQIDYYEVKPSVDFPFALISVDVTQAEDVGGGVQQCTARIGLRVGFDTSNLRTNASAPEGIRQASLTQIAIVNSVYVALQGWDCEHFGALSRKSQVKERRDDGLYVVDMEFETSFEDYGAGQ